MSTLDMYSKYNVRGEVNNNYFKPIVAETKTFIRKDGKFID